MTMAQTSYIRLYQQSTEPKEAFLLVSGNVYFFISETDKYAIRGNNLIVGSTELILGSIGGMSTPRLETAVTDTGTQIKKMPPEKFTASLSSYSFILNVSMVLAKQVMLTNGIINRNSRLLEGDEKKSRELCAEYYRIVSRLQKEYDKRRLPWLKEFVKKYETSLTFKRGEALERAAEPTKIVTGGALESKLVDFPRGSVICEEGSGGSEMYILESGSIDVYIGGAKVTSISEQGTVFGEMALLLGEKRTATLKAGNDAVLTVVTKNDLKEIAQNDMDIFRQIAASLAKKHYYNIEKIGALNQIIIEREIHGDEEKREQKRRELQHATTELLSLKNELTKLHGSKPAEFLDDLVESLA